MAPQNLASPSQLGGYRLLREVGRGASAVVWEAEHVTLKKCVAVKVLHPERAAQKVLAARFVREGLAAARVRHPHVVDVLDVGEQEGRPYLVMELVAGTTLASILGDAVAMSPQRLLDYMLPILSAVQHAHDCGVLHRDLKPANILIGSDRHGEPWPMVADFGISKLTDDPVAHAVTEDGVLVGTLAYMAPEQARSPRAVDARADQYALAVVLYRGVTGVLPYESETAYGLLEAIARGKSRSPRDHRPELPAGFSDALVRAMRVAPEDRFPSVRELARALLPFASPRAYAAFARDFEGRAPAAEVVPPGGTYDEESRGVETEEPIALDARGSQRTARTLRWTAVAALLLLGVAAFARLQRPRVDPPAPAMSAAVAPRHDEAPPAPPLATTATATPSADNAPTLAPTTAPPPPTSASPPAPRARAALRAPVVAPRPSPPAKLAAADAGAPATPPRSYELGDNNAPIVE